MLTRKKLKSSILTRKKSTRINGKMSINVKKKIEMYNTLLVEYQLKKQKCLIQFKECSKHVHNIRELTNGFVSLSVNSDFPSIEEVVRNYIHTLHFEMILDKLIKNIHSRILKVFNEWIIIYSITEVEYRKKNGLLYTLPSKKMNYFERVYPNIRESVKKSYDASTYNLNRHIPIRTKVTRVRFCNSC
tara:strand:- start:16002 stop:16565 length:564 start_codon:yes stop_codon:yes gene_type:complete